MIHLIGVDHLVQYENSLVPPGLFHDFKEFLTGHALRLKATLLAEEFHKEYLKEVYFSPAGTLEVLAEELEILHRYCDPGDMEKKKLGIPLYADIRESVLMELNLGKNYLYDPEKVKMVRSYTEELVYKWFPVRESFWLAQLGEEIFARVIFICGHEHITSFPKMLAQREIPCQVIEPFWRKDFFESFTL